MRKASLLAITLLSALVLAACGKTTTQNNSATGSSSQPLVQISSGDPAIDSEGQNLDSGLNNLDSDLKNADGGLNDTQTNLSD